MATRVVENIDCLPGLATMSHVPVRSSEGYEIHEYLSLEASFLDHFQYDEWASLLATDVIYSAPAQLFARGQAADLTREALQRCGYEYLIRYVQTLKCGVTIPNLHRLITNVIVTSGRSRSEFAVTSYLLVTGAVDTSPAATFLTVERRDVIRRCSRSYRIARREVGIPQKSSPLLSLARIL